MSTLISPDTPLQNQLLLIRHGEAAGLAQAEADRIRRPVTQRPWDWQPYPGAETWRTLYKRQAGYLESIFPVKNKLLVVVSHGGTLSATVAWWLNIKLAWLTRIKMAFALDNTGLTVLSRNEWSERTIHRLNDTAHLNDK
jgi:probable phosphoglycerate mutase